MTDRLSAEQRAELARLDELVKPRVLGCETTHARVGPRGGRMLVGLITSAFPLSDGDFAYMTVDMSRLLSMARTHLRALLAAAEEAERLRERVSAANERAKMLEESLARVLPSMGWRGTASHPNIYRCEFCGAEHEDCFKIAHTEVCAFRAATDAAKALEEPR